MSGPALAGPALAETIPCADAAQYGLDADAAGQALARIWQEQATPERPARKILDVIPPLTTYLPGPWWTHNSRGRPDHASHLSRVGRSGNWSQGHENAVLSAPQSSHLRQATELPEESHPPQGSFCKFVRNPEFLQVRGRLEGARIGFVGGPVRSRSSRPWSDEAA
jgi:hypothetical protein